MRTLIAFFARQRALGNVITLFVIVVGLGAAMMIRRDAFPAVNFDIITVRTLFPGGGADEVEKLVTNPIEQELKAVVTKEAEPMLAPNGVFGSNTSTLPISGLAQASANPANFIGIHFFSPVDRMNLVEIIRDRKSVV